MPPADLATYQKVRASRNYGSFDAWVRKMRPADRLILVDPDGEPQIPQLTWRRVGARLWSGRKTTLP
jgi:hypothetical protein